MKATCKKHKYQHVQNIETHKIIFTHNKESIIKICFRGEYLCSVCGKKHIGRQK